MFSRHDLWRELTMRMLAATFASTLAMATQLSLMEPAEALASSRSPIPLLLRPPRIRNAKVYGFALCKLSRQCIVSDLCEYSLAWALLLTWWGHISRGACRPPCRRFCGGKKRAHARVQPDWDVWAREH